MTTRLLLLLATFALLATARAGVSHTQPAPTAADKPAVPANADAAKLADKPAASEVAVKTGEDASKAIATKGKDAAGKDTLSVDFPDEDIRNILRNVADLFELNIIMPEALQGK